MKATAESSALWDLTWGNPHIDPDDLLQAVEKALAATARALDVRTKLLIRDSARALQSYWGRGEWDRRLERSPAKEAIDHHERPQADHNWYVLYGEQLPWPAPPGQEKRQPGNRIDKEARS